MATDMFQKLRAEALSLSEAERADLAYSLVASLDAPADMDAADAWDRELARRIAEVDAGTAVVVDRDEFRRRMQARLASN
jgi:putative addiction module component (TIGR02574 family)